MFGAGDLPMTGGTARWLPRLFAGSSIALVLGLLLSGGLGASAQLLSGVTEVGGGSNVGELSVSYWTWASTAVWKIPVTVPALASSTVGTPTRLATGGGALVLDAATAGNASVRWEFVESTAAPHSTEIELRFTVGLSGPAASFRTYLETQTATPTGALTFFLFWDAGTVAPTGITIETMQVDVLACSSVGHCP